MRILNEDQLREKLQNVSKNIMPEIKAAMRQACLGVEREAKNNCTPGRSPYPKAPFDTGTLRRSITSKVEESGNAVKGKVGTNVDYALYVHEGTSRMEARPFLLDAVMARKDATEQILRSAIIKAALKECDVTEPVTYLGVGFGDLEMSE